MVENKYQIGVRRFGLVNWVGAKHLYLKEINRFLVVWAQTLLSPLITSLLFLSVLSLALGNERGNVLGYRFDCNANPSTRIFTFIIINHDWKNSR